MLESERLAYLEALGITQYVALQPIAGTPALPTLADSQIWPEQALTEAEPATGQPAHQDKPAGATPIVPEVEVAKATAVAEAEPQPADAGADAEPISIPQLDAGKLKLEPERSAAAKPKPTTKAQRFALAVLTLPEQCRLFVELSVADAPGFSAVEHRMLSDMLAALGSPGLLDQQAAKLYRWPLVNNPRIAEDPAAARDGLLAFVASAPPVTRSLFLGTKAPAVLGQPEPGQRFSLSDAQHADALVSYSLAAMHENWQLKSPVWQQILPFLKGTP